MSFKVFLGRINKRENSTKLMARSDMTEFDCVILRGSGMLAPKIELDLGLNTDPSIYNFALIPAFSSRFYFVREWYNDNALWIAHLEVDVLASYKSEIGSTSLYVLRSAAASNGAVADSLYPVKAGCSYSQVNKSTPWSGIGSGFFVLGIVSRDGNFGSITYYALTRAAMQTLVTALVNTSITTANGFSWDDASQALQKAIIDPIQYIRSCVFIPRPISDLPGVSVSIPIFDWNIAAPALIPSTTEDHIRLVYDLPDHPDMSSRGIYLNSAPYTVLTLCAPPFGVIEIDTSVTCNSGSLQVDIHLDIFTGLATLEVICQNEVLNRIEAQVGVPIQISQVSRDFLGAGMSALGSVGNAVFGNYIGAAAGVGNALSALVPRSNTIGTQGSFTGLQSTANFDLTAQFFRPVADDPTHNGRPLCAVRTPASLGGYMLIQDGDVSINGTLEEGRQIRNYLEQGFYYE